MILRTLVLAAALVANVGAQDVTLDTDGFQRAVSGSPINLPADHASHPATRTEWWYLTGPLRTESGKLFGFQATWFRRGYVRDVDGARSPLAVRDIMLFHGGLSDVENETLYFSDELSRAYGPWAGASTERLDVRLFGNTLVALDDEAQSAKLTMRAEDVVLDLDLDLGASTILYHGEEPGLSIKGPERGQASWYYSMPRIGVAGTISWPDGRAERVTGRAWMDQEWGSSQLSGDQAGWDWFSVAFDDGTDLMLYGMRLKAGGLDATSSGSVGVPGKPARHLTREEFTFRPTGAWTSDVTGATYPSGWILEVPSADLVVTVTPTFPDQEALSPGSTRVTYWEGLCRYEGIRAGQPIVGEGYVELVGYDGEFVERL